MRTRRILLVFLCAICLFVCAPRASGVTFTFETTVEWHVADSELIARCRSVEISDDLSDPTGKWKKATFEVTEVLKGEAIEQVTVLTQDEFLLGMARPWREEQIVFFQRTSLDSPRFHEKEGVYPYRLRYHWLVTFTEEIGRDKKNTGSARAADLRVLRTAAEIETAIRAAIASPGDRMTPWLQNRDWDRVFGAYRSREADLYGLNISAYRDGQFVANIVVPFDSHLESMPYGKSIEVIRHIRSNRNIELLKEELKKDSFIAAYSDGCFKMASSSDRRIAFNTLQAWGVEVKRPVIDVPDDFYVVLTWRSVTAGITLVLLSLMLASHVVRRRLKAQRTSFRIAIFDSVTLMSAILALLLLFQWIDGHRFSEVNYTSSNTRYMARFSGNSLALYRITLWPKPIPLSVASYKCPQLEGNELALYLSGTAVERSAMGFKWTKMVMRPGALAFPDLSNRSTPTFFALSIPIWSLFVFLMLLPISRCLIGLGGGLRARRRMRAGLCGKCGYDLRASPERCPECGSLAEKVPTKSTPFPVPTPLEN